MLINLPSTSASTYLKNNVVNPIIHDTNRRSVIVVDGKEVDLRTASKNRSTNNKLSNMVSEESPISIATSSSSSSSSIQFVGSIVIKEKESDSDAMLKRMRKRASKFMHPTERPTLMTENEKIERSAAIKVNKLYSQIYAMVVQRKKWNQSRMHWKQQSSTVKSATIVS